MYDVIIIGAGAAGLTAAANAAKTGKAVLVLERNAEPAKKIYATGNGRCNFLNKNAEGFDEVLAYCNSIGICAAEEEGGRLYPRSRQAASVAEALNLAAERSGAKLLTGCVAKGIKKNSVSFEIETENGEKYEAKKLIIACGGKAGIQFGCYGDGFAWAKSFGHSVKKPIPALTGLECAEDISELHGVRVNARASLWADGRELAADEGELQFTKTAISGICVMNLSRHFRIGEAKEFKLKVDLFPEHSAEELETILEHQKQFMGCGLRGLVPEKMRGYLHERLHEDMRVEIREKLAAADSEKADSDLHSDHDSARSKDSKTHFAIASELAKALEFTVTGSRGWKDAQVTSGGVVLNELDEDFQSKLALGLFFAGEIIDYDGPCGGYNLAWAFRSGIAAGRAAAK